MVSGEKGAPPTGGTTRQSEGQLLESSPSHGSQIPLLLQITPVTFKLTLVVSETAKLGSGVKRTEIIIITVNILKHWFIKF